MRGATTAVRTVGRALGWAAVGGFVGACSAAYGSAFLLYSPPHEWLLGAMTLFAVCGAIVGAIYSVRAERDRLKALRITPHSG